MEKFDIYLAKPRGYCAGVRRAIEVVERALTIFDPPIYVKHEVVHNTFVVNDLKSKGVKFIEDIEQVPPHSVLIFSAHGVSQQVRQQATKRFLKIYDATCPLVTKVHSQVIRYAKKNRDIILIGHEGHPEVIGTLGQYHRYSDESIDESAHQGKMYLVQSVEDAKTIEVNQPNNLAYVTQTTLSLDDTNAILKVLKTRFSSIISPKKDDICYATQNRQDAVKELAQLCRRKNDSKNGPSNSDSSGLILVIGSETSSNSNRLVELAIAKGVTAYLIDSAANMKKEWLRGIDAVGVSAGASAPEFLVEELLKVLMAQGGTMKTFESGFDEKITFSIPNILNHPPSSSN